MFAYSLYDSKADVYGQPFFTSSDPEAIRGVKLGLRAGKAVFAQFPSDYRLCLIGSFNEATGVLVALPNIRTVTEVIALVEEPAIMVMLLLKVQHT